MGQSLKFMVAIIKPLKLDDVLETLAKLGIHGATVTEAQDYGQRGQTEIYRGLQYTPKFLPMLKIEAAVPNDCVEAVVASISSVVRTGQADDGKIFVFDLEYARHMRIGEVGETANRLAPRQAA